MLQRLGIEHYCSQCTKGWALVNIEHCCRLGKQWVVAPKLIVSKSRGMCGESVWCLCFWFCAACCALAFVLYFRPHFVLHLKLNLYYILKGEFFGEVLLVHFQVGSCYTFICYYILRCLCGKSVICSYNNQCWCHSSILLLLLLPMEHITCFPPACVTNLFGLQCYLCQLPWFCCLYRNLQHTADKE